LDKPADYYYHHYLTILTVSILSFVCSKDSCRIGVFGSTEGRHGELEDKATHSRVCEGQHNGLLFQFFRRIFLQAQEKEQQSEGDRGGAGKEAEKSASPFGGAEPRRSVNIVRFATYAKKQKETAYRQPKDDTQKGGSDCRRHAHAATAVWH